MARARNIKPGLYKNEDLAECSVWARYIFPGLWMLADREGRLEDRPKRIKAELLPFDDGDVDKLLQELHDHGFLVRYRNSEGSFIQISKFLEHQSPHYSEKPSVIKPPEFRESQAHEGMPSPRELPENSAKDPPIKRGSQPPDSLIPSLLNPDSHDSPNPEKNKARKRAAIRPDGVSEKVWGDFMEVRKAKRSPLTDTALHGIQVEATNAGLTLEAALEIACARGWQGFEAAWLNGSKPHGNTDAAAEAKRRIFGEEKDITHDSERL